ncbi:prealbumin-like fold domain-containing protein [Stenotrophomonas terrae]|uniref:prealbumin-like fold domain-containing protein n=1 Tax=Stenotrophomonas terrae TaxID=405446 RepID=UPI00070CEFA9|nr:DUF11 domain-containing protein [Stenotrophomonas terrae]
MGFQSIHRFQRCCLRAGLLALLLLGTGQALAQSVLWEDYRGQSAVPADANYIGPAGKPKYDNRNEAAPLDGLRALASNVNNAVRTGTAPGIDFRVTDFALCDNRAAGGDPNSASCRNQVMGRVMYALVRFPRAGTYTLDVAHDDWVEINFASDYTNTNYRTASYDIPVGTLSNWTDNENSYQVIGRFNAANDNACALLRVLWTNNAGLEYNRLRWQHPAINGGNVQIIPASQFSNPSQASSSAGCNGSITFPIPAIMIDKVVENRRILPADQFAVSLRQGGTVLREATTSGSGTGLQVSTGAVQVNTGATYTLRDAMAAGSGMAISDYDKRISCRAMRLGQQEQAYTPAGSGPDWTINVAANTQYSCIITNTPRPVLTTRKISQGGVGSFNFTGTNGVAAHAITTSTVGQASAGKPQAFASLNTATTLTEAQTPGFSLTGIQCTGMGEGINPTVNLDGRSVTVPAAAVTNGANIVCTFTNKAGAELSISKSNDASSLVAGSTTQYKVIASNGGPDAADAAVLRDTPTAGLKNCAVSACEALGGASCPATPADLLQPSGVTVAQFPAGGKLTLSVQCEVE